MKKLICVVYGCRAYVVTLLTTIILQGCAVSEPRPIVIEPGGQSKVRLGRFVGQPLKLIAGDLVGAIVQTPQLGHGPGVIQLADETKFDRAVKDAFLQNGFRVINVNSAVDVNTIVTGMSMATNQSGDTQTHLLTMGKVALKRSYFVVKNKVTPITSLFVRGVDINRIQLDDRIFMPNHLNPRTEFAGMYLCIPEGKGPGTDGWVCRSENSGKQWVDAATHSAFISEGMPRSSIDWDALNSIPDVDFLDTADIDMDKSLADSSAQH